VSLLSFETFIKALNFLVAIMQYYLNRLDRQVIDAVRLALTRFLCEGRLILRQQQLLNWLGVAGTLSVLVALPARAQVEPVAPMSLYPTEAKLGKVGIGALQKKLLSPIPNRPTPELQPHTSAKIPHPRELDSLLTEAQSSTQEPSPAEPHFWEVKSVAQAESALSVTGVQLNPTERGLEVILETPGGEQPQVFKTRYGETLAIDISNAQLRLPDEQAFRARKPVEGITSIEVVQQSPNTIRVIVRGTETVPKAEVTPSTQGVAFRVISPFAAAETPSERPAPEAEPPAPTTPRAEREEPIELIVTPTRTEEESEDVPRSVTVINREQIEEQTNVSRDIGEILGQLVPGLGPSTGSLSNFGQSLRGRETSVLIDGVPQSTNRNVFRNLQNIDPAAIERIEVLRGPTAIYGSEATGGVINIITRTPEEEKFTATTEGGLDFSLTHPEDSLGGNIQQLISGQEGDFDYTISASFDHRGAFFDAEGDRIPPDPNSQGGISDSNAYNVLGKLGVDLDEEQRLQLTFNRFDIEQDTEFTTDPTTEEIPGRQKSRTIEGLVLDTPQGSENTILNLEYTHENLSGSRIRGQLFYRDYFTRFFPSDRRDNPQRPFIYQSRLESEKLGGRFQAEIPLFDKTVTLLSGIDYTDETTSQPVNIFDPDTFDQSGGLVFEQIDERTWVPPLEQRSLGLFSRLEWNVSDQLILSGGIRYERIGITVDDFTTLGGNEIEGGELDYKDTLFNLGAVYDATDEVTLFANFSQGFSTADVGLVLRDAPAGFSVEALNPEAQRVNSYEVGVRGNWDAVQASLAGFYNTSNLGTSFDLETFDVIRAPERIYGIEATIEVQPGESWQLGGTASWQEGENDVDEDDNFEPLNGFRISPLKLTTYVEHETLPGWRNRFQALYVGNRDRAFDAGVDEVKVESYLTVDFTSSIELGPGTLLIGIGNLFNEQYFPVISQVRSAFGDTSFSAARGRTFSIGYRATW